MQAQQKVQVKGNIKNYKPSFDTVRFMNLSVLDLATFTNIDEIVTVQHDGTFSFSIVLQQPKYIEFEYLKTRFSAFARPGGTLYINFDDSKIIETLTYSGDEALLNNEMHRYNIAYKQFWNGQHPAYMKQYEKIKDSSEGYKKLEYQTLAINKKFLAEYSKAHKVSATFKSHASTDQKYSTAYNLIKYGLTNSKVSKDYYSFLKDFPADNTDAAYSGVYLWFLNAYATYLIQNAGSTVDNYVSYLIKENRGFLLDVLFSWQLYELMEANLMDGVEQYLPAYKKAVKNKTIKERILALYNEKQNELTQATLSKGSYLHPTPENAGQRIFQLILEKYKGRVVYVDFWGTWCVPCIEDIPKAKKLKEALKGEEVVFLYLAVESLSLPGSR